MSGLNSQDNLQELYGNIDIYLFDQLLKGTYKGCARILDAGCGSGRNVQFFLKQGFEVFGVDKDPQAIAALKQLASGFGQGLQADKNKILGQAYGLRALFYWDLVKLYGYNQIGRAHV